MLRRLSDRLRGIPQPKVRADTDGAANVRPDLQGRFCPQPFTQFDVSNSGNVYACCSNWLPTAYGNLNRQSAAEAWNSTAAQAVRKSIHDGSFKYCDGRYCPRIQDGNLPTRDEARAEFPELADVIDRKATTIDTQPTHINFCSDRSCNLTCPSCRLEKILLTEGPLYDKQKALNDTIVAAFLGTPTERAFTINVTGSGDPFASKIYREFLFGLNGADFPNLSIDLQTNGVLLTPATWRRMENIHANIRNIYVSFDAATPEVYAITRRGGHWDQLIENCDMLGALRREGAFDFFRMDFVVQADNYRDMPAFVRLGRRLGVDVIHFSMVTDRNSWAKDDYETKAVWKTSHGEHGEFLEVLSDPILGSDDVYLGNITAMRDAAVAAGTQPIMMA